MTDSLEREIKLRFESAALAREAVLAVGATVHRPRRLQDDRLLDWPDGRLRQRRCTLRVRDDAGSAYVTFKGPPQRATMKVREELEIEVKDAALVLRLLERLDLQVCFRYQKYREEYVRGDVILTIDDTPVGTYVELEGDEQGITKIAQAMGRTMADYVLESYRDLFATARAQRKLTGTDMVFDPQP